MRTSSTKNSLIIGISIVLGASLLSMGISNASGTTIKACAKKSGGAMRLIDSTKSCKKNERTLTWGTQGSTRATGATGSSGVSYATYTVDPGIGPSVASPSPYALARLTGLTSGNYLLNATMEVSNIDLVGMVDCLFRIPVSSNSSYSSPVIRTLFLSNADIQNQITANYVVENLPGGSYDAVVFECYVSGGSTQQVEFEEIFMSATKVDTLVRQ